MAELTDREKKIVLIKYIIHGVSPFQEAPIEVRSQMLQVAMKFMGFDYDESEMLDLGEAILAVQQESNDRQMGFLQKHPDLLKSALNNLSKGNDLFK